MRIKQATILVLSLLFGHAAIAHHSVPVNFDLDVNHTVTGIIKETHWRNPHSQIVLEVTNEAGDAEVWLVEWNAINTIRRLLKKESITTDDFKVGEEISVIGWKGRHNKSVYFREVTFSDGRHFVWQTRLNPAEQRLD
jgi:hypothetical protein